MLEFNNCRGTRIACVLAVATALCAVVTAALQLSTLNAQLPVAP
jgi:hypothetical protein